ncbi:sigma-70 family RNA polymerase sigma factor, partial [Bariatricus massiliensis]
MDHTIALIQKSHDGDEEARAQLVEENTGLVWCIVKRFYGRGTEAEDLFQIGSIGLLKAIDKFDISYDVKFSTYAVPMISGEIKRFLRDDGMIKVSRSLKELSYKAFFAKERLQDKLGREPDLEELAAYLEIEKEELVMAMEAGG